MVPVVDVHDLRPVWVKSIASAGQAFSHLPQNRQWSISITAFWGTAVENGTRDGAERAQVQIKRIRQINRAGIFALAAAGAQVFIDIARLLLHLDREAVTASA